MAPSKHAQSGQERPVDAVPSPIGSRVYSVVNFSPHLTLSLSRWSSTKRAHPVRPRARATISQKRFRRETPDDRPGIETLQKKSKHYSGTNGDFYDDA
jgi:hypothetical protein